MFLSLWVERLLRSPMPVDVPPPRLLALSLGCGSEKEPYKPVEALRVGLSHSREAAAGSRPGGRVTFICRAK